MKQIAMCAAAVMVAGVMAEAQSGDAAKVLTDVREALGGRTLAAVTSLSGTGRTARTGPGGNTVENEFEFSLQLPDKYLNRSVLAAMGSMSVYRLSGFNGDRVIDEIDRPPNLSGGHVMIRMAGPGGTTLDPDKMTPEEKAEMDRTRLLANKKEFARLALGMFASSLPAFPVDFTWSGTAESPDGKADVIDVTGEGGFAAKLFVDAQTHLPLMLSWMDKEPLVVQMSTGRGGSAGDAHSAQAVVVGGGAGAASAASSGGGGKPPSNEEMDKLQQEMAARRKEAEANRRTVEFRVYYADYKPVGGVMLPHKLQRSVDGKTTEETVFDALRVNPKIDAKTFQPTK